MWPARKYNVTLPVMSEGYYYAFWRSGTTPEVLLGFSRRGKCDVDRRDNIVCPVPGDPEGEEKVGGGGRQRNTVDTRTFHPQRRLDHLNKLTEKIARPRWAEFQVLFLRGPGAEIAPPPGAATIPAIPWQHPYLYRHQLYYVPNRRGRQTRRIRPTETSPWDEPAFTTANGVAARLTPTWVERPLSIIIIGLERESTMRLKKAQNLSVATWYHITYLTWLQIVFLTGASGPRQLPARGLAAETINIPGPCQPLEHGSEAAYDVTGTTLAWSDYVYTIQTKHERALFVVGFASGVWMGVL